MAEVTRRWSPYTYGLDNPIRFLDPDGMMNGVQEFDKYDSPHGQDRMGDDRIHFFNFMSLPEDNPQEEPKTWWERYQELKDNLPPGEIASKDGGDDPKTTDDPKKATTIDIPLPWPITIGSFLVRFIEIEFTFLLIPGDTPIDHQVNYIPPPRDLPGFPGATKVGARTGRVRWTLPNGDIAEWDSRHGDVEVYDKTGKKHKGSFDPKTGNQNKPPKKGRTTKK